MSLVTALRHSSRTAPAFAAVGLFWGSLAAQVPLLKARIGADDGLFGLLLMGTAIGLAITMIAAPIVDRVLGRNALPLAALSLAAAFLLPGLAAAPLGFFLAMICAGLSSGLTDVIMNSRVADQEARTGRALMNANHGMFSLAYAGSAFATGFAREAGIEPLWVFACLGLVTLSLLPVMRVAPAGGAAGARAAGRFPYGPVLLCGLVVLVAFMTEAAIESWSALHIERTLGGGAAEGAFGPTMLGLTMALGRFSGQVVSERFGELQIILFATFLAAAGALIAAIAPAPGLAYLGFGIVGLGVSVIGPLGLALVGKLVAPAQRTDAIAKAAILGFMGFFLAPALMGMVSDIAGLRVAFALLSGLVLVILPLLPVIGRRIARSGPAGGLT